jgi:hypothetical protein
MSHEDPKEYDLSVRTNDVHAAIAQTASALYEFVEEALQTHEDHEAEECEFESFARDILAVLARHADQLTEGESAWADDHDEVYPDEIAAGRWGSLGAALAGRFGFATRSLWECKRGVPNFI